MVTILPMRMIAFVVMIEFVEMLYLQLIWVRLRYIMSDFWH